MLPELEPLTDLSEKPKVANLQANFNKLQKWSAAFRLQVTKESKAKDKQIECLQRKIELLDKFLSHVVAKKKVTVKKKASKKTKK